MDSFEFLTNLTSFLGSSTGSPTTNEIDMTNDPTMSSAPPQSHSRRAGDDDELDALDLVDGERVRHNIAGLCIIA
ncbi:hypothetical protein D9756_007979 [Leucocoprinus leucothites]|uniref:Uncharacterized protein n=1 Tax=Leucocoprinus leucothites TaxID=201217 RepID=A0A8H5FYJ0_9AGAR|nr:hypothetical protein D9756_007979 [Leucoagaricus leucothites]